MSDWVTLTLAHPLTADQVARLRAKEVKDLGIGQKITVPRDEALAVINAGYAAGVEPSNRAAVAAAMKEPELETAPSPADVAPATATDADSGPGKKK